MEKPGKSQKTIQFPRELTEAIERSAEENNRSFSAEVVYVMRQYIKQQRREQERLNWGESVNR